MRIRLESTGIPGSVRVVDAAGAHYGNGGISQRIKGPSGYGHIVMGTPRPDRYGAADA